MTLNGTAIKSRNHSNSLGKLLKSPLFKGSLVKFFRSIPVPAALQESILFFFKLGYWPRLKNPRTYNEKINRRKLFTRDPRLVTCSDKLKVRDYIAARIGEKHLIPLLYEAENITGPELFALGDRIVAKATHDSQSAELIEKNSPERAAQAAERLMAKLKIDFGKVTNQPAYRTKTPRIIVERMLVEAGKRAPDDFKVYCFRQEDGTVKKFVECHQFRGQENYRIGFFDDELRLVPLRRHIYQPYESFPFPCPEYWPAMAAIAETIGREFDHVRVDLYVNEATIYFGELTFFNGGGRKPLTREGGKNGDFDLELGEWWKFDDEGSP